ncbi:hypothetical protein F5Y16DRAFT_37409 [Xylariaceae sp. FL0255]|nr:hypothetical protein F5Y16DRAFT_37409 [Xylariaceae sp. FL0255]
MTAVFVRAQSVCHAHYYRHRAGSVVDERNAVTENSKWDQPSHHWLERGNGVGDDNLNQITSDLSRVTDGLNNATSEVLNFIMQLVVLIESLSLKLSMLETTTTTTTTTISSSNTPALMPQSTLSSSSLPAYNTSASSTANPSTGGPSLWSYPIPSQTNTVMPIPTSSGMYPNYPSGPGTITSTLTAPGPDDNSTTTTTLTISSTITVYEPETTPSIAGTSTETTSAHGTTTITITSIGTTTIELTTTIIPPSSMFSFLSSSSHANSLPQERPWECCEPSTQYSSSWERALSPRLSWAWWRELNSL